MEFQELIQEAVGTLLINKLRTSLAILGIVIGIASVIALVSLGQASQRSVEAQIQSLGSNLLTVIPGGQSTGGVRGAMGGATTLTLDDAHALATSESLHYVNQVSPEVQQRAQVTAGRNNTNTQVMGVYPTYATVRNLTLSSGVFITSQDISTVSKVAVVGPQVVEDLFPDTSPIGKTIRINGQMLRIIGITNSRGGSGFQNQDDVIYVPLSTAQRVLFGISHVSSIAVEATSRDVMTQAQDEIGYFLLERHKIKDPLQADFSIFSQNDILNTASQVTGTFTTLLSGIAAISLLVGGIGIMNIMLVSVTERTREIGLRKALGAKYRSIITQFLIEAVILTIAGGLAGISVGVAISLVLSRVLGVAFYISPPSILLALVVSCGIGVTFGWYPAKKAASLQPIEALRYE